MNAVKQESIRMVTSKPFLMPVGDDTTMQPRNRGHRTWARRDQRERGD